MIEERTRRFTESERARLGAALRGSPPGALRGLFAASSVAVIAMLVSMILLPERLLTTPVPPIVGAVAGVAAFVITRLRLGQRGWARLCQADLDAGVARVRVVRPDEAIAIEESEDEGSQYLLRLGDGRALFIVGQDLYEVEEGGRFPSREIELVYAPISGLRLAVVSRGEVLRARRRPPFRPAELEGGDPPADGEVLSPERYRALGAGAV